MVSIAQTSRKYRGRKAATYDEIREKQGRWRLENETVASMLMKLCRDVGVSSVVDCPVGTGRFLQLYAKLAIRQVVGIDASEEMLRLARRKVNRGQLHWIVKQGHHHVNLVVGDAANIKQVSSDVVVCVRFLDLIEEEAMRKVMSELCRVARRAVVLTIRWGENYVPKVNTATHDRNGFKRLVGRLGWRIEETVPIFDAGWVVIRLGRKYK